MLALPCAEPDEARAGGGAGLHGSCAGIGLNALLLLHDGLTGDGCAAFFERFEGEGACSVAKGSGGHGVHEEQLWRFLANARARKCKKEQNSARRLLQLQRACR